MDYRFPSQKCPGGEWGFDFLLTFRFDHVSPIVVVFFWPNSWEKDLFMKIKIINNEVLKDQLYCHKPLDDCAFVPAFLE